MATTGANFDLIEHFENLIEESRPSRSSEEISVNGMTEAFLDLIHRLAVSTTKAFETRSTAVESKETMFTRIAPRFCPTESEVTAESEPPTELDKFLLALRSEVKVSKVDTSQGQNFFICHSNVLSFEQSCHVSCHGSRGRR